MSIVYKLSSQKIQGLKTDYSALYYVVDIDSELVAFKDKKQGLVAQPL